MTMLHLPCGSTGAQLALAIDRAMFDCVEAIWEVPTADELARLDGVRVG